MNPRLTAAAFALAAAMLLTGHACAQQEGTALSERMEQADQLFKSREYDEAGVLFRKWNPSHGIDVNDAFLAASARRTGGRVFTLNKKHYPMPDVLVSQAWRQ